MKDDVLFDLPMVASAESFDFTNKWSSGTPK
jgi:hypothetical protein